MKTNIEIIGDYCRKYRMNVLQLTLKEMEKGRSYKALSSFENGRSSNINHLIKYVEKCRTKEEKIDFLQGLIYELER